MIGSARGFDIARSNTCSRVAPPTSNKPRTTWRSAPVSVAAELRKRIIGCSAMLNHGENDITPGPLAFMQHERGQVEREFGIPQARILTIQDQNKGELPQGAARRE